VSSCLFLTSYLTRFALSGDTRFEGEGAIRYVYFAILISHVSLAIVIVPLVLRTLYLAVKKRFEQHRRIARWTLPLWTYVSITGVVVYLMLYHWPS
jgi:putative membrane protein